MVKTKKKKNASIQCDFRYFHDYHNVRGYVPDTSGETSRTQNSNVLHYAVRAKENKKHNFLSKYGLF